MLPPDFKKIILDRVDIVDLIGHEIPLKRSGTTFSCLCPFHNDKNPSMHIWEDSQRFKCFACGKGGDAITFTIEYFKLPFLDALKELAKRYNVPIPESKSASVEPSFANEIYRVNAVAMSIFRKNFVEKSNPGAAYMQDRGFTKDILELFNIGFAPSNDERFSEFQNTEDKKILEMAGLIKLRENGLWHQSFFNRVMFPIEDERGRVLGFGGRTLNLQEKAFKYLNTSDTEVFHKRKLLYGIKQALENIKSEKKVIITEGYTDVLIMHQHGFKNTVAVLGTALTSEHIRLIKRFCKEAVLLLDGDEAGQNAMMRSMETFLAEDFLVSVATLPDGKDPYDILSAQEGSKLQQCVDDRISDADFLLNTLKKKFDTTTIAGKTEVSAELVKLFTAVKNPVKLSSLISTFSEKLEIDELSLRSNFSVLQSKKGKFNQNRAQKAQSENNRQKEFSLENFGTSIERLMLTLALKDEAYLNDLAGLGIVDYLSDFHITRIFTLLLSAETSEQMEALLEKNLTDTELHLVNHLKYSSLDTKLISLSKEFDRLKIQKKQDQKNKLLKEVKEAQIANDSNRQKELLAELLKLK